MRRTRHTRLHRPKRQYTESFDERLQAVMPEVHRQVFVYEEKLKKGTLKVVPKHTPLFSDR